MYDCCYCLRYTLLAWGITKKQVRYLIILESTHFWVTVSVSPVPSGTSLAFFDSMGTVVSGTVFIVIRLHASNRIKLITVHQHIFDKKQYFLRLTHDCSQAVNTDIWTRWSSIAAVRRRLWSKCRSHELMCEYLSLVCRHSGNVWVFAYGSVWNNNPWRSLLVIIVHPVDSSGSFAAIG